MTRFFMFGTYSHDAVKGISAGRTEKAMTLIKKYGGEVQSMYTLLGLYDVIIVVDFPGLEEALQTSVALYKLTGISFATSPVVEVAEFDKLVDEDE